MHMLINKSYYGDKNCVGEGGQSVIQIKVENGRAWVVIIKTVTHIQVMAQHLLT